MKSIRGYLLSRLLAGAALALGLAGLALVVALTRALDSAFDRGLAERVRAFASILFQTEDEVSFEFSEQLMPEYGDAERPAYFELRFADGPLLEASPSLGTGELTPAVEPGREPQFWSASLPDGRPGRFVVQQIEVHHVYPEEGPGRPQAAQVRVVVARGTEELVSAERKVLLIITAAFLGLIAMIGALARLAVERGLEPARRLAAKLDLVQAEQPPAHLDVGALPIELAPVAAKTDLLLQRVGRALERERRTTADIAHELRTPISELLTVSEVALRNGSASDEGARAGHALGNAQALGDARQALTTIRDVSRRMGNSVATLLELARLEMGALAPARVPLELGALVAELVRAGEPAGRARGVEVHNHIEPGERVEGDRDVLRIVLSNLLDNALRYAVAGSPVSCRFARSSGGWSLAVENRTDELEPADLRSLSQPFWRKDSARSDRNHSGLGLALARALADRAGLVLAFELEERTFRATLSESRG